MVDEYKTVRQATQPKMEELLEAMQERLVMLLRDRKELDAEIQKVTSEMLHLSAVLGVVVESPLRQLGITDAIRHIIGTSDKPMSPVEIKEALLRAQFKLTESNPLAPIHVILRRLEKSKEIEILPFRIDDDDLYSWRGKTPPPLPIPDWMSEDRSKKKKSSLLKDMLNKQKKKGT